MNEYQHPTKSCSFRNILLVILVFFFITEKTSSLFAQCDARVSGVLTYCFSQDDASQVSGYFVGFRVKDLTGDTLNVVDLTGQVPMNRGKRVDDINTQAEPAMVTVVPLRISGVGADTLEFWYFGPFNNGTPFNVALIDPNNMCDTVFVASGTYTCTDMVNGTSDPFACMPQPANANPVPLYFLDFSSTEFIIGGGGGGNEDFDQVFLIMQRTREDVCCDLQNSYRCFEFIVRLADEDIGLAIDDVGSGSPGGQIYADSLNGFVCTGNTNTTYPFIQDNGQNGDAPLCLPPIAASDFIVLTCKSGGNVTGVSIDAISNIFAPPEATIEPCNVSLEVFNVDSAFWSSPDDPNLDNLISCNGDSLFCTFFYDTATFGEVTVCGGDTFVYIVGGMPAENECITADTILYDTTYVVVYPVYLVQIDTMCHPSGDSLILTANVTSAAAGCEYAFDWSTGDTTQAITVPFLNTELFVTVTRGDLPISAQSCISAVDSIITTGSYSVSCQNITDTLYTCISELPNPDNSLVIISGCGGGNFLVYNEDTSNGGSGCPEDTLVITRYRIVDFDGDTVTTIDDRDTCTQLLAFVDNIPPVITSGCPADVTVSCANQMPSPVPGSLTASDNCGGNVVITHAGDVITNQTCVNRFKVTRTYQATDACGNSATCAQTITVFDNTPPVITCPVNVIVNCQDDNTSASTGVASATDNCSGVTITQSQTSTQELEVDQCAHYTYVITRTWVATDVCGNSNSCDQTIQVQDVTTPVITCPENVTVNCQDDNTSVSTGVATATDNSSGVTITHSQTSTQDPDVDQCANYTYVITRTWVATDVCGNSSSCVQTIQVQDVTAPVITCPADITILYPESTLPANMGNAIATDICDQNPFLSFIDSLPDDCPLENRITRTWSATDMCGNSSTCQQSILIDDRGSICGSVYDDLGQPLSGVEIRLEADINNNQVFDGGDTLVAVVYSDTTGQFCFLQVRPCNYIIVEIQPATYGDLADYDLSPDPDGDDSGDGPDNQIPVSLWGGENDTDNNFVDIICPTQLPVIPPDTICANGSVAFQINDLNLGMLIYTWNFGSGSTPLTGIGLGPHSVSYITTTDNQANGAVIMMTINKTGCPDLSGQVSLVEINPYPNAAINGSTTNLCYFNDRTFQPVTPQIPGATYQWTFGTDAVPLTATDYGPHTVQYTSTGVKTVKLVIYPNEQGAQCSDSSSIMFNVVACPANITGTVKSVSGQGIAGVNIRLFTDSNLDGLPDNGTIIRSVYTTSSGVYSMVGITPGHYVIVEIQPPLWVSLDDDDTSDDADAFPNIDSLDNLIPATLTPSEIDANNNFIESPAPGSITGTVFIDLDEDEIPDAFEGLSGGTLSIYHDDNIDGHADNMVAIATQVTNSAGFYSFTGVPIGNYVLAETQPISFISIKDVDASNDLDLVLNLNMNNDTIPVTITNGEHDDHNYFIDEGCILLVMNTLDSGPGSLRDAIECAADGDTIRFDNSIAGMTINITLSMIEINKEITIFSSLAPRVTIASLIPGLFSIANNGIVEFRQLDIISGLTIPGNRGAAFENKGYLKLHDVYLFRNPILPADQYLIRNWPNSNLFLSGNCEMD